MSGSSAGGPGGASSGGPGGAPKGGSASKTGATKEMFGEAKNVFKNNKNAGQANPLGGQVDDEQEDASSVQETAKSSGKGRRGAQKTKDAAKKGKSLWSAAKNVKSLAPLISVLSGVGIALLIIFLIIGFIGFFTTLPGLAMEKFVDNASGFLKWLLGSEKIDVSDEQITDLANYIQELGYDLEGCGFVKVGTVKKEDKDNKDKITSVEWDKKNSLYAYILQNERTYTLQLRGQSVEGTIGDLLKIGVNFILPPAPYTGIVLTVGQIGTKIAESFDTTTQGMLIFEDLREDVNTKVEVDRVNNKVKIKEGLFQVDQVNYDLNGWTGRYGKPIELSLALHLSTMAPDFVYNFCMNEDLQTEVHISTIERNYDVNYYFETADGTVLDKDKVNEVYEKLETAVEVDENYTGTNWRDKRDEDVSLFTEDGQIEYPYVPIQMLDDLSTMTFMYAETGNISSGTQHTQWISLKDTNNDFVTFYDNNGKPKQFSFDISGITVDSKGKMSKTPQFVEGGTSGIEVYFRDSQKTKTSTTIDEIINEGTEAVSFWKKGTDTNGFYVTGIGLSMNGLINKISNGTFSDSDAINEEEELGWLLRQVDKLIADINKYTSEADGESSTSLKEVTSKFIAKHDSSYDKWYNSGGYYHDSFVKILESNDSASEKVEKLKKLRDECKADYELIQEATMLIKNDSNEELEECGGISISTLRLLHDFFNGQAEEIKTYEPYIEKVTNHWYKDVYFVNEDGSTDGIYDFHQDGNGNSSVRKEEYNPEGLAADDETLNKLNEEGTIYVEMKGSFIEQLKQPEIKKDEKWHYMVKNWLTNGYFFIYDGTIKTAEEIESARKYLKGLGYDPENPLLVDYDNSGLLTNEDNEPIDTVTVEEIEKKAEKLNSELANADYTEKKIDKEGKEQTVKRKYNVRLQKINFAKKSSLAAFSILEGVHTEDGEYVYRDLKEFLIELGYFTEADFETIETGVLDWIIPEYVPDEWPNIKYEKKKDEYGTYIRSKASVDKEREEEEKALEEVSKNAEEVIDEQTEIIDGGANKSEEDDNKTEEGKKIKEYEVTGNAIKKSAVYEEFAESGEGYQTIITVNGITYRNYKQFAFPDIPYSEGHVDTSGCGATSVAIVLTGYGYDIGVPEVANWIRDSFHPNETAWYSLQQALEHFGGITSQTIVGSHSKESTAQYVEEIRKAFSEGKPVIANVGPSYEAGDLFTGFGHYLVLLGEDEDGTVLIGNPSGSYDPNAIRNKYTPGLEEFVRLFLTEQNTFSSGAGGILIPDEAPTGVSFSKKLEGFEAGLEVITPGEAEVMKIEGNSITLKFTAENKVKNMTMKIEGISLNPDIAEGDKLESKQPIGTTTEEDIKLLMRDEKKAIINNIEDYMIVNNKNILRVDQPYPFTEEDVEIIAKLIAHEMRPSVLASAYGMEEEEAMEAGKVCGYVLVNRALVNYSGNGTTLLDQLCAPGQYAGADTLQEWANVEITPDVMEAAEWVSKYDCSSVLNPRGEPMTRNVLSQSGWCFCNPKGTPGSTCWWWIDTYKDGKVTEANSSGAPPYDSFYCKNSDYPEK